MPRYYLHLSECGTITPDVEGGNYPDLRHAREAAISGAREIMCAELAQGKLCLGCHVEIADDAGPVEQIPFRELVTITGL